MNKIVIGIMSFILVLPMMLQSVAVVEAAQITKIPTMYGVLDSNQQNSIQNDWNNSKPKPKPKENWSSTSKVSTLTMLPYKNSSVKGQNINVIKKMSAAPMSSAEVYVNGFKVSPFYHIFFKKFKLKHTVGNKLPAKHGKFATFIFQNQIGASKSPNIPKIKGKKANSLSMQGAVQDGKYMYIVATYRKTGSPAANNNRSGRIIRYNLGKIKNFQKKVNTSKTLHKDQKNTAFRDYLESHSIKGKALNTAKAKSINKRLKKYSPKLKGAVKYSGVIKGIGHGQAITIGKLDNSNTKGLVIASVTDNVGKSKLKSTIFFISKKTMSIKSMKKGTVYFKYNKRYYQPRTLSYYAGQYYFGIKGATQKYKKSKIKRMAVLLGSFKLRGKGKKLQMKAPRISATRNLTFVGSDLQGTAISNKRVYFVGNNAYQSVPLGKFMHGGLKIKNVSYTRWNATRGGRSTESEAIAFSNTGSNPSAYLFETWYPSSFKANQTIRQ
ncbi:hypothetical protein EQG49_08985 [Periweissella cryptocerci]|uniref:Uncharacterized protein n=1 Tax=Periweissella cryptocerci TaxID=2506420 RepID=A0A4P6YUX4_9LACO|nr:hypothetical protein [Periweissella cryptocerci]QBO36598.1 hypothetical protein EQG49_08985 [Periweissella cryptocerci]